MMRPLQGRSAVITGSSEGLGRAIAEAYLEAGAHVFLCARDADRLEDTRGALAAAAPPGLIVAAMAVDVSDERRVGAFAAEVLRTLPNLDILVNNAGVYGPMGATESVDWQEWTQALAINLFGSVLMARAFLPHFKQQRRGKIIQLSGGGATNPLPRLTAYAASKAAVVRFAESLALEVESFGIDVNAIAPGALNTGMMDEFLAAGPDTVGEAFYARLKQIADAGGTPLHVGAALAVFLGSTESDGITGRLLSAPWDAWRDLPRHREALGKSDVYTLRRIVPADRGFDWGQS